MLTCQELTELVTDYLEGNLSFADRLQFKMNLGMCPHCRRFVQGQKLLIDLTGQLPPEPLPEEIQDDLLAAFRGWKKE